MLLMSRYHILMAADFATLTPISLRYYAFYRFFTPSSPADFACHFRRSPLPRRRFTALRRYFHARMRVAARRDAAQRYMLCAILALQMLKRKEAAAAQVHSARQVRREQARRKEW